MYTLYCNENGFSLMPRFSDGNSLEDSHFELEYDFNMNQTYSTDYRYIALGYYSGVPVMIYQMDFYYRLVWLNCTPKEAYEKGLALKLADQKTIQVFLMWCDSITDPVLLTFKEMSFLRVGKDNYFKDEEIFEDVVYILMDHYEKKTGIGSIPFLQV